MLPPYTNSIASEHDEICDMNPEESLIIHSLVAEARETLEDWTSDNEDSDLSMKDIDEQVGSDFFADSIFGDEPFQEQVGSIDFDLESEDYFTCRDSPVSLQNFSFVDDKYREAFKNLDESMKRSQETRASLKIKSPVKGAAKYWEERRKSISTVPALKFRACTFSRRTSTLSIRHQARPLAAHL
jgi:hypothetical protein